jgi:hypothetical protein
VKVENISNRKPQKVEISVNRGYVTHKKEDEDKLTKEQEKDESKNGAAMNYLILALEDDAFDLVTRKTIENVSVPWKILMHEYKPADKEGLVELQRAHAKLKMGDKEKTQQMMIDK